MYVVNDQLDGSITIYQVQELIFMTEEGMKTFEVSVFECNVVDVGMEGTLVFQGYQLLSFGDWIKEFSL